MSLNIYSLHDKVTLQQKYDMIVGRVAGISHGEHVHYDVQPEGKFSLADRIWNIPAARLKRIEQYKVKREMPVLVVDA